MILKDNLGIERVRLANFQLESENPIFVGADILITLNNITAEDRLSFELSDFKIMLSDLSRLNNSLKYSFYFFQIERRFELHFKPNQLGEIGIKGHYIDPTTDNRLLFAFSCFSNEIEEAIRTLKNVIAEFS